MACVPLSAVQFQLCAMFTGLCGLLRSYSTAAERIWIPSCYLTLFEAINTLAFSADVPPLPKNPPQHQKSVQAQKAEVETYSENATLAFL